MKTYEFLCGGDYGAWECTVSVKLSQEEVEILKEYANNALDEFLGWNPPVDKIYFKVMKELEKQCDNDFDANTVVIRYPFGLKEHI